MLTGWIFLGGLFELCLSASQNVLTLARKIQQNKRNC